MLKRQFDYEQNYEKLQEKVKELKDLSANLQIDISGEIEKLEDQMKTIRTEKYACLSPWEKVLLSRHPERPGAREYIEYLCEDWIEMHGDRLFGDDRAIVAGVGSIDGQPITILAHQKGKGTRENVERNFGMPHPEGYRKVERQLLQAEKFHRPVLNLVDTPGAYPGVGAEERGQAGAIAQVLMTLSGLRVPVISIVTGEGGSGGALALGVGDRLIMLSNSVFSVISAEACASIMFKEAERAEEMASALKLTPEDLISLGIINEIIEEPIGGAHMDFTGTAAKISECVKRHLDQLRGKDVNELMEERYRKIRNIGRYTEAVGEERFE